MSRVLFTGPTHKISPPANLIIPQCILKITFKSFVFRCILLLACYVEQNQSRLIVASHDLTVQFWNINDGANLIQLLPQVYSTTLAHVYSSLPRCITALAQDSLPIGQKQKRKKLLFVGTEHGNICAYPETSSVIDPVPQLFLRVDDASAVANKAVVKVAVKKKFRLDGIVGDLLSLASSKSAAAAVGGGGSGGPDGKEDRRRSQQKHGEQLQKQQGELLGSGDAKRFQFKFDLEEHNHHEAHHHPHHHPYALSAAPRPTNGQHILLNAQPSFISGGGGNKVGAGITGPKAQQGSTGGLVPQPPAGSPTMDSVVAGSRPNGAHPSKGRIGEVLFANTCDSNDLPISQK